MSEWILSASTGGDRTGPSDTRDTLDRRVGVCLTAPRSRLSGFGLSTGPRLGAQCNRLLLEPGGFAAQSPAGGRQVEAEGIQCRADDALQPDAAGGSSPAPPDLFTVEGNHGTVALGQRGPSHVERVRYRAAAFGSHDFHCSFTIKIRAG